MARRHKEASYPIPEGPPRPDDPKVLATAAVHRSVRDEVADALLGCAFGDPAQAEDRFDVTYERLRAALGRAAGSPPPASYFPPAALQQPIDKLGTSLGAALEHPEAFRDAILSAWVRGQLRPNVLKASTIVRRAMEKDLLTVPTAAYRAILAGRLPPLEDDQVEAFWWEDVVRPLFVRLIIRIVERPANVIDKTISGAFAVSEDDNESRIDEEICLPCDLDDPIRDKHVFWRVCHYLAAIIRNSGEYLRERTQVPPVLPDDGLGNLPPVRRCAWKFLECAITENEELDSNKPSEVYAWLTGKATLRELWEEKGFTWPSQKSFCAYIREVKRHFRAQGPPPPRSTSIAELSQLEFQKRTD